jgi:hypothetical protein
MNLNDLTELQDTRSLDVDENKEEAGNAISYEQRKNILCDFSVKEFMRTKISLLITQKMITLYDELHDAIEHEVGPTSLLHGPCGIGKTTTLFFICHLARTKGYVVFQIQARDFVNQAQSMSSLLQEYLTSWIAVTGESIVKKLFGDDNFGLIKRILSIIFLKHEGKNRSSNYFK